MEDLVGYGFRPTDDELVGYYLHNKILGNSWLVDGAIREVNICSFDPWDLRFQSKIKSKDRVWYFFSRREKKHLSGNLQLRRTSSGFWKLTGAHVDIKDQWGIWCGSPGKIGHKRVLGFHTGRNSKGIKSDWVIHEYHYTLVEQDERPYVICRLEYKGDDRSILFDNPTDPTPSFAANTGSVVDRSLEGNLESFNHLSDYDSANQRQWFGGSCNLQQQFPYSASDEDNSEIIRNFLIEKFNDSLVGESTYMQENFNDYWPKKPVTGVFTDDSSDSDTDSTTCRYTSSCTDTVGSSNEPYHTTIDDIPQLNTIELFHNYEAQEQPEQLKLHLQGKEKVINMAKSECELKMAKDLIKKISFTNTVKQNKQWIYHLTNMIIGVLLFISVIGWIILVG